MLQNFISLLYFHRWLLFTIVSLASAQRLVFISTQEHLSTNEWLNEWMNRWVHFISPKGSINSSCIGSCLIYLSQWQNLAHERHSKNILGVAKMLSMIMKRYEFFFLEWVFIRVLEFFKYLMTFTDGKFIFKFDLNSFCCTFKSSMILSYPIVTEILSRKRFDSYKLFLSDVFTEETVMIQHSKSILLHHFRKDRVFRVFYNIFLSPCDFYNWPQIHAWMDVEK